MCDYIFLWPHYRFITATISSSFCLLLSFASSFFFFFFFFLSALLNGIQHTFSAVHAMIRPMKNGMVKQHIKTKVYVPAPTLAFFPAFVLTCTQSDDISCTDFELWPLCIHIYECVYVSCGRLFLEVEMNETFLTTLWPHSHRLLHIVIVEYYSCLHIKSISFLKHSIVYKIRTMNNNVHAHREKNDDF